MSQCDSPPKVSNFPHLVAILKFTAFLLNVNDKNWISESGQWIEASHYVNIPSIESKQEQFS